MESTDQSSGDDPVVIYDVMWEATNRLGALYAERVSDGGIDDPAVIAMRTLNAEVESISTHDLAAQRAKTAELAERYKALSAVLPNAQIGNPSD